MSEKGRPNAGKSRCCGKKQMRLRHRQVRQAGAVTGLISPGDLRAPWLLRVSWSLRSLEVQELPVPASETSGVAGDTACGQVSQRLDNQDVAIKNRSCRCPGWSMAGPEHWGRGQAAPLAGPPGVRNCALASGTAPVRPKPRPYVRNRALASGTAAVRPEPRPGVRSRGRSPGSGAASPRSALARPASPQSWHFTSGFRLASPVTGSGPPWD